MTEEFDVIVVGARCAGAPLAALLARRGVKVALVEQATFPSDTLSTHVLEAQALTFLDRLGVMQKIRATGAPFIDRVDLRQEDLEFVTPIPLQSGDVGGTASVRRLLLDPILAQTAAEAGADLRMASRVTGLVEDQGRVAGVRVPQNGSETTLQARLVVGADGRNSTIASLVGARKYNLTPNERFMYWSFFEGVEPDSDPAFVFHRWGDRMVIATHADSGLYQVILIPDLGDLPRFREDLEGSFMEYARSCRPVAQALSGRAADREVLWDAALGGVLPGGLWPRLGAGRRRRTLQGPHARPGHTGRVSAGRRARARDRLRAGWLRRGHRQ